MQPRLNARLALPWAAAPLAALQELAGDASLLLLVGGLTLLCFIVLLVLVQSLLPVEASGDEQHHWLPGRELRPLQGASAADGAALVRKGSGAGRHRLPLNQALRRLVSEGHGEPRLLVARPGLARIRLYGCRACLAGTATGDPAEGCVEQRWGVQEAVRQAQGSDCRVRETACRRRGDAECEFEVAA